MGKIELFRGDITTLEIDAIVNAANRSLLGGGGVDGAIHKIAGKELLEECKMLNGCKTGEAKFTKGYNLPAKYVIHAVGPIWRGGKQNEAKLLENAYMNSLKIARKEKVETIAFPAISTGIYSYPLKEATEIAIKVVKKFLKCFEYPQKIIFVAYSDTVYDLYKKLLQEIDE